VCFNTHQYVVLVSMFFKIYLETTFFKKRSLLAHCQEIHFDLTHFVDNCMRYFLCNFLSLPIIIDFALIYLTEGVRAHYREIHALLRVHKNYLKGLKDPKQFLSDFQQYSIETTTGLMMRQNRDRLRFSHFSYKIKYTDVEPNSGVRKVIEGNSKDDQCTLYQPNEPIDSKIITYELYVKFWQFLPGFMRIRSPELIFRATEHGYNIHTFYARCEEYAESYYFCLILIRTTQGGILGCLIDDIPE